MIRRRVVVSGHVQGVFFRDSVRRLAHQRKVNGWVANRPDGSVEAVFEGDADALERLVDFCRRGPRGAQVDAIEVTRKSRKGSRASRCGRRRPEPPRIEHAAQGGGA